MNPAARIIDANANRAREALRVMEDLARFALNDPALSAELKSLRHDLRAAIDSLADAGLDRATLLAHRDTDHDVGTTITTPAEPRRERLRDLALAAASRLTEALRTIEEAAKLCATDPSALGGASASSATLESLRYRAYTAEQKLALGQGKGTFVSQEESVRLKNDNLQLRKLLAELRAQKSAPQPALPSTKGGESAQRPIPPGTRTHVVQAGETMASIAQKFYKDRARWKDIQDANFYSTSGTPKIKVGQTLIIP